MSWQSELSDDETMKIHWNTSTNQVKIENLKEGETETWMTPIGSEGVGEIDENIVPGFSVGKWFIKIGRLVQEALT